MAKPRKRDPFPNAHDKYSFKNRDVYRSSRWGSYEVYPDGRIFLEDKETVCRLLDQRRAATRLFEMATQHVQDTEEKIAKAVRQIMENFEIDSGKVSLGWMIDLQTGELSPPTENEDSQDNESEA